MRCWIPVIAVLTIASVNYSASYPAHGQELPALFNGIWVSVNPPGPHITFTRTGGRTVEASLPVIGQAQLRTSDGVGGSNLRVSGEGFNCFYFYSQINRARMVWEFRGGDSVCPRSMTIEKDPP
jgi:hypothetical protein